MEQSLYWREVSNYNYIEVEQSPCTGERSRTIYRGGTVTVLERGLELYIEVEQSHCTGERYRTIYRGGTVTVLEIGLELYI